MESPVLRSLTSWRMTQSMLLGEPWHGSHEIVPEESMLVQIII